MIDKDTQNVILFMIDIGIFLVLRYTNRRIEDWTAMPFNVANQYGIYIHIYVGWIAIK